MRGNSVNAGTPPELCTVHYKDLSQAIALCVQAGKGCYVGKADMKSTFRNLPIKKQDWMLLVLMAVHPRSRKKYYFVDKCLPFSASIPCSHFQRFSNCIAFLIKKCTGRDTNNYLDDFLFAAPLQAFCDGQLQHFLDLCDLINFPVAPEKMVWGTTVIVFLGIPVEKRDKAIKILDDVITSRTVTVLKTQQLTGLLNFLATAIIPGRTFTRRMYAKYSYPKIKQHYHVKADTELKADCRMWKQFLDMPESLCRPSIDFSEALVTDKIDFYTDASGAVNLGFGCVLGKEWTQGFWNPSFMINCKPSIEYLELYAMTVAILLWARNLQNRRVVIFL